MAWHVCVEELWSMPGGGQAGTGESVRRRPVLGTRPQLRQGAVCTSPVRLASGPARGHERSGRQRVGSAVHAMPAMAHTVFAIDPRRFRPHLVAEVLRLGARKSGARRAAAGFLLGLLPDRRKAQLHLGSSGTRPRLRCAVERVSHSSPHSEAAPRFRWLPPSYQRPLCSSMPGCALPKRSVILDQCSRSAATRGTVDSIGVPKQSIIKCHSRLNVSRGCRLHRRAGVVNSLRASRSTKTHSL